MIYSRKHGYLFIHIPKTGGTSMALALERRAAADDIMLGDTPKALKRRRRVTGVQAAGRLWKHSMLSDLVGLISEEEIAAATVFTMVRNPWDRLVSYYRWLQTQSFAHPAVAIARAQPFSGFLNHPDMQAALRANPYERYVTLSNGAEKCDQFVRLEHLEEDLPKLEELIDLRLAPLPHANESERKRDYRVYYSEADQQLVARLSGTDLARFGYSFE